MSLSAVISTIHSIALHYRLLFHLPTGVRALETPLELCGHIMCAEVAALYLTLITNRVYDLAEGCNVCRLTIQ